MVNIDKKIFQEFDQCNKCGLCQSVCPVYKVTKLESYSPRGKVRLTKQVCLDEVTISKRVKSIFETCLLCGACYNICPANVHGNHLFSGMRWEVSKVYGVDWRKKLLYLVLNKAWRLKSSAKMGRWAQKFFDPILSHLQLGNIPADRVPEFNKKPFNEQEDEIIPAVGDIRGRVLYFHGCATNYLFEKTGLAVVDVLTRMGFEVHVPAGQGCCGLPIFLSGARDMSLQCIKNAVEQFGRDGFAAVIVDCATCGSTFKNEYPRVLQEMKDCSDDIPEELLSSARKMAKNTFDIMQFVAKHEKLLPEMNSSEKKVKVTYHDPCHLSKGQSVKEEPRRLLKHIPGIEFVEAAGADECCGGGGSFQVDYPAISKKNNRAKTQQY